MNKEELKQKIEEQERENINLYNIFKYRLQEEEMQPLVNQWRVGSKKLRELDNELFELEKKERDNIIVQEENTKAKETKTFINGYGEATKRYITSSTYERAEKRRQKEILSFIGNR